MINKMLDDAGLVPTKLTSIAGLPEFLYEAQNPQFNLRKIVNTNLIIVTLKAAWDAYQDKQNMTAHKYSRRDMRRRLAMYITNEIKLLPWHIDNAHKHSYYTIGGNTGLRKRHTERERKCYSTNRHFVHDHSPMTISTPTKIYGSRWTSPLSPSIASQSR